MAAKYCQMTVPEKTTALINSDVVESFETDIVTDFRIDEWKHLWNGGVVTYAVLNQSNDSTIQNWENRLLALSLRTWQFKIKDIRFKRERINPKSADIVMKFEGADNNDTFKNRRGTLAYAYFPGQGNISGDITFNDDYIWTPDGRSVDWKTYTQITGKTVEKTNNLFRTYNAVHTLTHEIGHALGLRHNTNCTKCMMYPYYNGAVTLATNDTRRIQGLEDFEGYGVRGMSQYWSNYWHNRAIRRFNGIRGLR